MTPAISTCNRRPLAATLRNRYAKGADAAVADARPLRLISHGRDEAPAAFALDAWSALDVDLHDVGAFPGSDVQRDVGDDEQHRQHVEMPFEQEADRSRRGDDHAGAQGCADHLLLP